MYLSACVCLPSCRLEQIDEMDKWEGSQLNKAKEILAFELTKLVHGEEEATKAQEGARALFAGGANTDNMPTCELSEEDFADDNIDILTVLTKSGLAASRSEARRNVEQGGVSVDGTQIKDIKASYTKADFAGEGMVVKRGKKKFMKVTAKWKRKTGRNIGLTSQKQKQTKRSSAAGGCEPFARNCHRGFLQPFANFIYEDFMTTFTV